MGKKFVFLPKPKNKQIQGQLTHSGSSLLKSFHCLCYRNSVLSRWIESKLVKRKIEVGNKRIY